MEKLGFSLLLKILPSVVNTKPSRDGKKVAVTKDIQLTFQVMIQLTW